MDKKKEVFFKTLKFLVVFVVSIFLLGMFAVAFKVIFTWQIMFVSLPIALIFAVFMETGD